MIYLEADMQNKFVPNSFMVANAFVDECMDKLSDAAVKIYLIIVRKTRGWTKECDALSLSQLEEMSKKSRPTVVRCLKELVSVGLVKKHHQSVYGNVFSLIDNYFIGVKMNFPSKKSLLVREFLPKENAVVKNFNYPNITPKQAQNLSKIRLIFPSKKILLVKSFYLTSKNILPLLVKIFNTQKTLSKNINQNKKRTWLDFEILKDQIVSIDTSIDTSMIFNAPWFKRELEAFEEYNAEKKHSDKFLIYFFADWLMKANVKHNRIKLAQSKQAPTPTEHQKSVTRNFDNGVHFTSKKQLYAFAKQLSLIEDVFKKYGKSGESWQDLGLRIANMLTDSEKQKPFIPYLIELGFQNSSKGDAA